MHGRTGFTATVEPIAGSYTASLIFPKFHLIAGMILQRLQRFGETGVCELGARDRHGTWLGAILEPQLHRIHTDTLGHHVHGTFSSIGGYRRTWRAIGNRLGAVAHHVITHRAHIGDIVRRKAAHAAVHHRRTGEGTSLVFEQAFGGDDLAVAHDADLDRHRSARGRPGGLEHIFAAHHDFHRMPRLARQRDGYRLHINHGLAAKGATDLGGMHPQITGLHAEQLGGEGAHHEVPLTR